MPEIELTFWIVVKTTPDNEDVCFEINQSKEDILEIVADYLDDSHYIINIGAD